MSKSASAGGVFGGRGATRPVQAISRMQISRDSTHQSRHRPADKNQNACKAPPRLFGGARPFRAMELGTPKGEGRNTERKKLDCVCIMKGGRGGPAGRNAGPKHHEAARQSPTDNHHSKLNRYSPAADGPNPFARLKSVVRSVARGDGEKCITPAPGKEKEK